jgi:hypothetical protein
MKKFLATIPILAGALLAFSAVAQIQYSNEFWISTNATGNTYPSGGTLDNPLDGSTEANFDHNMNSLPQNSTIHILPGVYQTYGGAYAEGWSPKSGDKVLGSGIDVTVIQLATNVPNIGGGTAIIYGSFAITNCEISDLTCDGDFSPSENVTLSGIAIGGARNAVRRVKVKNLGYTASAGYSESFGIVLGNGPGPNSEGNIIEECEIDPLVSGHSISGLTISGTWTNCCCGIIRDNVVFLTNDPSGAQLAINGSWDSSVLIEGNYVDGADVGVYGDTGGCTNMIIAHNIFKNCFQGVSYSGYGTRENITIDFNNLQLAPSTTYANLAFSLWPGVATPGIMTNVVIIGNTISLFGAGPATAFVIAADTNVASLIFADNTIDPLIASNQATTAYFILNGNVHMYNNYDLYGNYIDCLNIPEVGGVQLSPFALNLITSAEASSALTNLGLPNNPADVVTNNETGVTLSGTFSGNGSGLTNITASSLPFYIRAGTTNFVFVHGGSGTLAVQFSTPVPDTNYVVTFGFNSSGSTNIEGSLWYNAKTTNGFTTEGLGDTSASFDYIAVQKQ